MTPEQYKEWAETFYGRLGCVELNGEVRGFKEDIENEGRHEACLRFIMAEVQLLLNAEREACAKIAKQVLDERSFGSNVRIGSIVADVIRARSESGEGKKGK
jgi:hypothetical protein